MAIKQTESVKYILKGISNSVISKDCVNVNIMWGLIVNTLSDCQSLRRIQSNVAGTFITIILQGITMTLLVI